MPKSSLAAPATSRQPRSKCGAAPHECLLDANDPPTSSRRPATLQMPYRLILPALFQRRPAETQACKLLPTAWQGYKSSRSMKKRQFAAVAAPPDVRFCRRPTPCAADGWPLFERAAFLNVVHVLNSVAF